MNRTDHLRRIRRTLAALVLVPAFAVPADAHAPTASSMESTTSRNVADAAVLRIVGDATARLAFLPDRAARRREARRTSRLIARLSRTVHDPDSAAALHSLAQALSDYRLPQIEEASLRRSIAERRLSQ